MKIEIELSDEDIRKLAATYVNSVKCQQEIQDVIIQQVRFNLTSKALKESINHKIGACLEETLNRKIVGRVNREVKEFLKYNLKVG